MHLEVEKEGNFVDDINTKQATKKLMAFSMPIIFAILLQSLYGAVDLLVVGQFAETADVSGVATGNSILQMITMFISGLSVGVTVFVGYNYGQKDTDVSLSGRTAPVLVQISYYYIIMTGFFQFFNPNLEIINLLTQKVVSF